MTRLPLLLALALGACTGSAHAATEGYGVGSFDKIRVAGPFDVHVHVGGSPAAHATGPQEALDRLSVEQHDDVLVIRTLPGGWGGWPIGPHGTVVVDVVAPTLAGIAVTGSGGVSVDRIKGDAVDVALSGSAELSIGQLDVDRLTAVTTGSGDLVLAGRTRQAKTVVTGSGDLKGEGLMAVDADVSLVGSGDLAIGAQHAATITLVGSGDATVTGPAVCTIHRSGSGDVHCDHPAHDD